MDKAKHDDNIEKFHLATNIDQVGAFDDICFRAKLKGLERPLVVFVQAKHRENDKVAFNNKNNLAKYFNSYLNIKQAFKPNNKDAFFDGKFEDIECFFTMYTTAKNEFENVPVENSYSSHLYDLIGTGGTVTLPYRNSKDVEFLCKIAMKEQIISLAALMVKFINDEGNIQMMLDDELILRYHVILAQKVLDISDIQPEGYRIATFRQDFFDTNEESLVLFKEALYTEILKKRKLEGSEGQNLLTDLLKDPSDITVLSKLIGTVITYNNGQLELIDKTKSETIKRQLKEVYVPQSAVSAAVQLAAKAILSIKSFRVPTSFGNKDLTIWGNDVKIARRIKHLTSRILDLLNESKFNKIVTLDESSESGLLQLNGGIGSAIGNILALDEDTKLIKFADNRDLFGDLAKRLYDTLLHAMPNLHEYRFILKVKKFPKLSLEFGEYEESLARDFLNKLLYYTNQADVDDVEVILKSEIGEDQRNYVNSFQIKTHAIFLKFHDEIQKWWMTPIKATYLTKKSKIFEDSINNIVKDPLMSVLHMMFMNKIKYMHYTFSELAVTSLKLEDQKLKPVIVTESSALTVAKVIQYLKNEDHIVLDLEYILNMPMYDSKTLLAELTKTSEERTLVLVCDKIQYSINIHIKLQNISKAIQKRNTIVVTNHSSLEFIKQYFQTIDNLVYDETNNLTDLCEDSQKSILEGSRVIFQGKEISLNVIVDDESKAFLEGDVLNRIINKDTIAVGKPFGSSNYDDMKYLFIDRRVKKTKTDKAILLESLHDISDDVVLVTAKPGMGKSTLLTHLSHKTKELDPKLWIVRVNLLEYSRVFSKWKENNTVIDSLETLNFMCQVILQEKLGKDNKVEIALEEANGAVYLRECTGDQWTVLELKLFLHYYCKGTLIFLFDGFDEICPDYMNEVMQFLKTIRSYYINKKHRMWVTSRPYNDIKNMLQQEFGSSYEIERFSYTEREKYLDIFWKTNLKLKDFNSDQLENVREFLEFMSKINISGTQFLLSLLYDIFISGGHYLINEIKYTHIPLWRYNKNIDDAYYVTEKYFLEVLMSDTDDCDDEESITVDKSDGSPLHLYLAADYFISKLEEVDKRTDKWNLDIDTFAVYERFLEKKLKAIRFEEKNAMDIYNPDIKRFYDQERVDFLNKHKMLAVYAIFREQSRIMFSKKEIKKIKNTIRFFEKGAEKTGLILSIENNIPIFIHMTFTEYFAVDYICDLLKKSLNKIKQKTIIDFIFNVILKKKECWVNVRKILDHKMKTDKDLMNALHKNQYLIKESLKEHKVDPVMIKETKIIDTEPFSAFQQPVSVATDEHLDNVLNLFISIFKTYLNEDNFKEFLEFVKRNRPRIEERYKGIDGAV